MDQISRALLAVGAGAEPTYVDDVFSTYLYTGTGATQTINNGVDLAGKGGLVWIKSRTNFTNNALYDTARGAMSGRLITNSTVGEQPETDALTTFNASGFSLGADTNQTVNESGHSYTSWTFRKAPKFFDVVTYTGNGSTNQVISHSLGVAPGVIIVKALNPPIEPAGWLVYHRSLGYTQRLVLNSTNAAQTTNETIGYAWGTIGEPTATTFTVGDTSGNPSSSENGVSYVAYLFAHDTASDGLIQCGSFTTDGNAAAAVTLGWEPQWLLVKRRDSTDSWYIVDSMRGLFNNGSAGGDRAISADAVSPENGLALINPTSAGFETPSTGGFLAPLGTFIYIAIRRPNKPPTTGTQVFSPYVSNAELSGTNVTTGFVVDAQIIKRSRVSNLQTYAVDRLRGVSTTTTESSADLYTPSTSQEAAGVVARRWNNSGYQIPNGYAEENAVIYSFRRAPGFFDVVCYTGTGSALTVPHSLMAIPDLIITKGRTTNSSWTVTKRRDGNPFSIAGQLNDSALDAFGFVGDFATTSFTAGYANTNFASTNGVPYVAYLFGSLAGISKVGEYTGNGTSQTINCGFTTGARFVLIKRINSTGDWYVWDTARGIVAANDPYLRLNSTLAETTTDDSLDPDNSGFVVNQTTTTNINVSAATYIFLAIA